MEVRLGCGEGRAGQRSENDERKRRGKGREEGTTSAPPKKLADKGAVSQVPQKHYGRGKPLEPKLSSNTKTMGAENTKGLIRIGQPEPVLKDKNMRTTGARNVKEATTNRRLIGDNSKLTQQGKGPTSPASPESSDKGKNVGHEHPQQPTVVPHPRNSRGSGLETGSLPRPSPPINPKLSVPHPPSHVGPNQNSLHPSAPSNLNQNAPHLSAPSIQNQKLPKPPTPPNANQKPPHPSAPFNPTQKIPHSSAPLHPNKNPPYPSAPSNSNNNPPHPSAPLNPNQKLSSPSPPHNPNKNPPYTLVPLNQNQKLPNSSVPSQPNKNPLYPSAPLNQNQKLPSPSPLHNPNQNPLHPSAPSNQNQKLPSPSPLHNPNQNPPYPSASFNSNQNPPYPSAFPNPIQNIPHPSVPSSQNQNLPSPSATSTPNQNVVYPFAHFNPNKYHPFAPPSASNQNPPITSPSFNPNQNSPSSQVNTPRSLPLSPINPELIAPPAPLTKDQYGHVPNPNYDATKSKYYPGLSYLSWSEQPRLETGMIPISSSIIQLPVSGNYWRGSSETEKSIENETTCFAERVTSCRMAMVLSYHYDILYGSREVFSPSSQHHHIALRIFRMSFINKACETKRRHANIELEPPAISNSQCCLFLQCFPFSSSLELSLWIQVKVWLERN
ncbi:hypothetical protein Y032_0014g2393 [Ancylostoma ceylanicum]|uniref:Uncharacterized protein n=2 Tax=Ancylostoma ceylanicum TaxID=53326 RepID=A0A016VBY5_9BILA|nr:hypothetical protein Y032_0014g2393 [Ancylostoma ceylanicum]